MEGTAGLNPAGLKSAPSSDAPLVGIIGAGVAGLRAAQALLDKGYNVAIFEARERVGGRVCSSDRLGRAVDLGPNWIHGTTGNPIIPLSELAKSTLHNFEQSCPVMDPDGQLLPQSEADQLQDSLWQLIDQATDYSKEHKAVIPSGKSLYDYGVERADEIFGPSLPAEEAADASRRPAMSRTESSRIRWKGHEKRKELFLSMLHMWGSFIGSSVTRQSLKFFLLEEPVEGPNLFVASTYEPMVDVLATSARDAGVINLSTPITSVTVTKPPFTGHRRILLAGPNSSYSVDSLIVTIPLGCLKRSAITFDPPLPQRIQQSIHSLSYGHLEKVYIRFPGAYWLSDKKSPGFFTFLTPKYAPETNPSQWHMCCFSLAHLPEPYAQATLLFYIFGPTSAHLTSESFASPDTDEGFKQLSEFFEPYFSRLHGYKAESPDCKPAGILRTDWSNDEFAGYGSYSNFQVGLEDGERDIEAFREGMPDRGIWFAGEHTAPILGLGSVSGAYWSGEIAAEKVVESYEHIAVPAAARQTEAEGELLDVRAAEGTKTVDGVCG